MSDESPPPAKDDQTRDDADLVEALRNGERDALAALFRRHHRAVYRFAVQMTGSRAAADDVTQDVFVELARGRAGYDAAKGTVAAYLYGIARHLIRQRERRLRLAAEVEIDAIDDGGRLMAPPVDPVARLAADRQRADLRRAILGLPSHYREAVVLCELHGLSYEVAAHAAGCPVGTIRSRLSRARAMLVERCRALGPEGRDESRTHSGLWTLGRQRMLGPES